MASSRTRLVHSLFGKESVVYLYILHVEKEGFESMVRDWFTDENLLDKKTIISCMKFTARERGKFSISIYKLYTHDEKHLFQHLPRQHDDNIYGEIFARMISTVLNLTLRKIKTAKPKRMRFTRK